MCETVVSKKCKKSYKKGCKNARACHPGPKGNSGKCVFCCTGPDCDKDPESHMNGKCGGSYNTSDVSIRRKRATMPGESERDSSEFDFSINESEESEEEGYTQSPECSKDSFLY